MPNCYPYILVLKTVVSFVTHLMLSFGHILSSNIKSVILIVFLEVIEADHNTEYRLVRIQTSVIFYGHIFVFEELTDDLNS